ncbi:hypothetical protein [Sphingomonas alpina]|nr:hypothetical protein [Sphingomonas alpina]
MSVRAGCALQKHGTKWRLAPKKTAERRSVNEEAKALAGEDDD